MIKTLYLNLLSISKSNYTKRINKIISILNLNNGLSLIDIGAAGQIMPRWLRIESFLNYHGFEPDDRSRSELQKNKNGCISYTIYDKIVSNSNNDSTLNLCRTPMNSSTLSPNDNFISSFSNSTRFDVIGTIELPTTKIDDLEVNNIDFIKLDIQGGELNALRGGKSSLSKVLGLEIEIEFQEIYKNQPLYCDINSFMTENDFTFIDFPRLVRWDRDNVYQTVGQCVWGDSLYMRTPEYMIKNISDVDTIKRYLTICLIYHRYDFINKIKNHFEGKVDPKFFHKTSVLRKRFLFNQLLKRRVNNFLSLFQFFDEEIHTLH